MNKVVIRLSEQHVQRVKTHFICADWTALVCFILSIMFTLYEGLYLYHMIVELQNQPTPAAWIWMLIMTIWCFVTGIIFIVDLIVASNNFDACLTGYLMVTWVGLTGLLIWKIFDWLQGSDARLVYDEYVQMSLVNVIVLNIMYILALYFPVSPPVPIYRPLPGISAPF